MTKAKKLKAATASNRKTMAEEMAEKGAKKAKPESTVSESEKMEELERQGQTRLFPKDKTSDTEKSEKIDAAAPKEQDNKKKAGRPKAAEKRVAMTLNFPSEVHSKLTALSVVLKKPKSQVIYDLILKGAEENAELVAAYKKLFE